VSARDAASRLREAIAVLDGTVDRLAVLSRRHYHNPYAQSDVAWPETIAPADSWCTAPELTSLYGTPLWDELAEPARRTLAFFEAVNFFSLNIHGEKALMAGLATRLYRPDLAGIADYLHHFLDEENKHSVYFGGFCSRYAHIYRSRQVAFPGSAFTAEQDDFLFFAKTMIFEEIVDYHNAYQAKDMRLHPMARFINKYHHDEETRHLVFGRRLVARLWAVCAPAWGEQVREDIREYLRAFVAMAWREYYNPDVYADCGLDDPWGVAERAWETPAQRSRRHIASGRCLEVLRTAGIFEKDPDDF
jgi:hypothetical protein